MTWPAYPRYRDSRVDWLGDVPDSWAVTQLRHVCKVSTGDKDTINRVDDGEYPFFIRSEEIQRINSWSLDCEAVLTPGDGAVGKVFHHYVGKFDFHQRVYAFYDFRMVLGRYFFYYLSGLFAAVALDGSAKTTVDSLRMPLIKGFQLTFPSSGTDQREIVEFLDRETAKIDALIGKQERLIATLQERRGAVADQLLNPPGLILPLKRIVADVTVGIVVTPSAWYADEGVPALRGLNIRPGLVTSEDLVYLTPEGDALHAKSRLCAGDVVMVRTGQAGSAAVIPNQLSGANAIDLLIIRPGAKADPDFLAAYFNAPSTREKIAHGSVGAIQGHFNVSALRELEFPSIDIAEQRRRAEHWSIQACNIDALIEKTETFIELSREYRSALITDVVTGKIDVRGAA
ncbi:restriction endonuclease subunit S [Mycobacterium sp. RTGN5]|uniref:restriction endonuclease subunit S n=1 Tax=Mycobacterium sp. RTGN5 TaxID=3016522 RepID=UPI0029C9B0B3|nr:restriction endonuclease subunit S [Mycobacterium sp. RTGN5]